MSSVGSFKKLYIKYKDIDVELHVFLEEDLKPFLKED
jgi:hypothetical protein